MWKGTAFSFGLIVATTGCASPCEDDGFAQEGCPVNGTETETEGADASADATAADGSADNTVTASDTESAGTVSADGTNDTLDSTAGNSGGEDLCPILNVDLTPRTPTVMLLVDQSGSMTAVFGDSDRWNSVVDALVDPDTGIVATYDDEIRFGLNLYTGTPDTCPVLTGPAPELDNFAAIDDTLSNNAPSEETPTGDAIQAITETLVADTFDGPKLIVLATDGEPDTCAEPNPQNGQEEAVAAAEAAFDAGIEMRVISVGSEVSDDHLQDMANAGQGVGPGDPDVPFYRALDPDELNAAFNEIINGARDCLWTLDSTVTQQDGGQCNVEINGTEIPFEGSDGWRFVSDGEIELLGGSCDSIQEGDVNIQMICGCDIVVGG